MPEIHPWILVVDDQPELARLAADILRHAGYQVHLACNQDEALDACSRLGGPPDLLVTDVLMPDITGPDLALKIMGPQRLQCCLFVSGFPGDSAAHLSDFEGRPAFLAKPFAASKLVAEVRRLLSEQARSS
jgi:two-component system, cell cycle sensor histidine kinase and response regulator CckA